MIDTALDRSIAVGYGNLGLLVRRHLPGWPTDSARMDGKTVVVTGAGSGIGLATAEGFATLGATVHAVTRNDQRADQAVREICAAVPGADVRPVACDVSSLDELRKLGRIYEQQRIDVLVNNAGVMPEKREHSVDGHELMFATHVLAPFALTSLLSNSLTRGAPARVINVSSGGMYAQGLHAEDLESEHSEYSAKRLYARTKRQQVVITELWAERLRDRGIFVHAMHPGWADTPGVRESMPAFRSVIRAIIRTPEQGADTIVWLGSAPAALQSTGGFWHDRRARPTHYLGVAREDEQDRRRLWHYCQSILDERLDS